MGNASSASRSSEEDVTPPPKSQTAPPQPQATQYYSQAPPQSTPEPVAPKASNVADNDDEKKYTREPRLSAWVCLFCASIIALTAVLSELGGKGFGAAEWVLLVTVISVIISLLAMLGYHWFRKCFVGTIWGEGISAYLLVLFWIGGIPVSLSPSRALAVTRTDAGLNFVINANLYFSCWCAFMCNMYICGSWTMDHWEKAAKLVADISMRLAKWWGLFIASIILLAASAQFHYSQSCSSGGIMATDLSMEACSSNKYAIGLGAFGAIFTLIAIILAHLAIFPFIVEAIFVILMFALYTAGIAVVTYNEGPGITIGNIYFSTWAGFIISILLCLDCYHEHMKQRAERPPSKKKRWCRCWGHHDDDDELSSKKATKSKKASKPKSAATHTPRQQQQQQPPQQFQSARKMSMRSSLDEDDFADARDDLELKL